jgi:DNA-binding GntR family transcriptional regulator
LKNSPLDIGIGMSYLVCMVPCLSRHPLRPGASTPLWLQLKHALRDVITFELKPGERLPSESELCRHYRLSRVTVRQAITSLANEGMLRRQQGLGTYVLSPRLAEPLADPEHFLRSGFDAEDPARITVFSAETVPAADWVAAKLGISPGEDVHKLRKLLSADGAPAAFRTTFVPKRLAPSLLDHDLTPPIHQLLESLYRLQPTHAAELLEVIVADEFRADMLHVRLGHPLILVERLVYLDSGAVAECSRAYYRADRFSFHRRLRRASA